MCQLVCVHTGNVALNRIFLTPQLQIDAAGGNRDGTGILMVTDKQFSVWKTEMGADSIINLGNVVRLKVKNSDPVIAHVRAASKGIDVVADNAHPFIGARFALAHNGRLWGEDEKPKYYSSSDDTSTSSDSQRFLEELEKCAKENGKAPFLDLINKAMEKFRGKFAFLVFDALTGSYYIARGNTADLHLMTIYERSHMGENKTEIDMPLGFIVNTRKNSLVDSAAIACQIAQAATGRYIVPGDVEELKKNTVYKIEGQILQEIGELKEREVVYYTESTAITPRTTNTVQKINLDIPIWKYSQKVLDFMESHFLNPEDIDLILMMYLGKPMGDLDEESLVFFVEKVIPIISAPKQVRRDISDIIRKTGKIWPVIYTKVPGLEYPWTINHTEQKVMKELKKVLKQSTGASK